MERTIKTGGPVANAAALGGKTEAELSVADAGKLNGYDPAHYLHRREAGLVYYVTATGDDQAGDGSQSKPYRTIQHCIDNVPPEVALTSQIAILLGNSSVSYAAFTVPEYMHLRIEGNTSAPGNTAISGTQIINHGYLYLYGIRGMQPIWNQHTGTLRLYACSMGGTGTTKISQCVLNLGECYIDAKNDFLMATYAVESGGGHVYFGYSTASTRTTIHNTVPTGVFIYGGAAYASEYLTNSAPTKWLRQGSGVIYNNGVIV